MSSYDVFYTTTYFQEKKGAIEENKINKLSKN